MAKLAILIFVCCASPILFGQSKNTQMDDVNSILDDLDRRLTDQENQVLTFDEQRLFESEAEDKGNVGQTLNFKPKSITASRNVDDELMRLSNTMLDLDKRIEELDSRV